MNGAGGNLEEGMSVVAEVWGFLTQIKDMWTMAVSTVLLHSGFQVLIKLSCFYFLVISFPLYICCIDKWQDEKKWPYIAQVKFRLDIRRSFFTERAAFAHSPRDVKRKLLVKYLAIVPSMEMISLGMFVGLDFWVQICSIEARFPADWCWYNADDTKIAPTS
ncbi:hypothetical protein DUI87_11530 [Hirundo rustica rustica]|uniref:Uncharacterized protein n=1 Tax=Hirundo rustica rustica TaxID=333673 RepID=A0A3M0KFP5_HIRRU|nr:hypothetical protein DUI87_11530 [Hirundo rustica rustica]